MSQEGVQKPAWKRRTIVRNVAIAIALLAVASCIQFAVSIRALRDHLSAGPQWAFPSRVYSDALSFRLGRALPAAYLHEHLALRGYREVKAPISKPGTFAFTKGVLDVFTRGIHDADDPLGVRGPEHFRVTLVHDRVTAIQRLGGLGGYAIADTLNPPRLEPVQVAAFSDDGNVRRNWVPLASVPPVVRDAVIASEDRRFYHHFGIDFRSNVRALVTNARAGGVRQGASTITQQLARGLFLSNQRTWFRKVREAFLALGLERLLSKDEILEMYLNSVYWGREGTSGVAGIGEAARRYFDSPVETLDLGQAALLVGIIPAPNLFSPFRNPRIAKKRRDTVLDDMVELGMIDRETATREQALPIEVSAGKPKPGRFPSYTSYVREYLRPRLPAGALEHSGLSIYTTLDPVWQEQAEATLAGVIAKLPQTPGADSLEGAYVALDPRTGEVRAMVGGREDTPGGFNRAFQALRQPGSAIKPVVYSAALDPMRGSPIFGPATVVPDRLRDFTTPQGPWRPHNDEEEYHDGVTLAKALAKSLNVATANVVEAIGPKAVTRYGERFGLRGMKPVPSVGLGTSEVTLVGLADAYTTFPNGGERTDATPVRAVIGPIGGSFCDVSVKSTRVIPPETAALMTGLLEDVVIFGVSNPLRKQYGFTRPVGGKTGTTNDFYDAWFVGFTPDVVAGVWVGYDTPKTLGAPASEMAIPVWAAVTSKLLTGFPPTPFTSDSTLKLSWIDPYDGKVATPNCPYVMRVPFLPGAVPAELCTLDHTVDWQVKLAKRAADSLTNLARLAARKAGRPDTLGLLPSVSSEP